MRKSVICKLLVEKGGLFTCVNQFISSHVFLLLRLNWFNGYINRFKNHEIWYYSLATFPIIFYVYIYILQKNVTKCTWYEISKYKTVDMYVYKKIELIMIIILFFESFLLILMLLILLSIQCFVMWISVVEVKMQIYYGQYQYG